MKAFIILNKGFEYNDQIHSDSGGGTPRKVYFTREEAKKEIDKLNIAEFKSTDIEEYCYDISDIANESKLQEIVEKLDAKYGKSYPKSAWDKVGDYRLNENATFEESMEYMKCITRLTFYELVETEVDESDFIKTFRESKLNEIL
jgi:hypothetical protein